MSAQRRCPEVPHNAWYAAAISEEVGRTPLARTVLGTRLALYRTTEGRAVALHDRCAHAPVPLSDGRLEGDDIVSGYTGFRYAPDGSCTAVPTQAHVPFGTRVTSYPVVEDGSFVWVWLGDPRLARLRPPPDTEWLRDPKWATFGSSWQTAASLDLMQDNFADITHVAIVDPQIAPPALTAGETPPLRVQVSEATVSFSREFPPARLPLWHAEVLGLPADAEYAAFEQGEFVSPGLWVDRWEVQVSPEQVHTFVFTHALTPVDERHTRHVWRVSRDFADSAAAEGTLRPVFERYYLRVRALLEQMQQIQQEDGPRQLVHLASDAAGLQVRRIMSRLVADETGTR